MTTCRKKISVISPVLIFILSCTIIISPSATYAGETATSLHTQTAKNISALVSTINSYNTRSGGTGHLSTEANGNELIVRSHITGATEALYLIIENDVKVRWEATITPPDSIKGFYLNLIGDGTFSVESSGRVESNLTTQPAIICTNQTTGATVVVNGGVVKGGNTAIVNARNTFVSGGVVEGAVYAIYAPNGNVGISGGTVQATGNLGVAVRRTGSGNVTVSGGIVQAAGNFGIAVSCAGSGNVTVSGGEINATGSDGKGIVANGNITVSGGTIRSENSDAIYENGSNTTIFIDGGTVITGSNIGSAAKIEGVNDHITVNGGKVISTGSGYAVSAENPGNITVNGGTVQAMHDDGMAIMLARGGNVTVNGGIVSAKELFAIWHNGTATIHGGAVFAYGTETSNVIHPEDKYSTLNIDHSGTVVAWNKDSGTTVYDASSSMHIMKFPDAATAIWYKEGAQGGIQYTNGSNTGFIPLDVTVRTPNGGGNGNGDGGSGDGDGSNGGGNGDGRGNGDGGGGNGNGNGPGNGNGGGKLPPGKTIKPGTDGNGSDNVSNVTNIRTPMTTLYMKKDTSMTSPVCTDVTTKTGKIVTQTVALTWKSSTPNIASVDAKTGRVKANKAGKATITATAANGKKLTIKVSVMKKAVKLKKLLLSKPPKKMTVGKTAVLKIKLSPRTPTNLNLKFKSSNKSVLAVDKAGKLTALKKGKAKITVASGKTKVTKTITVTS